MNDSQDFQDAESVKKGNSHVTSQPMLFRKHPIPEGMLRFSFVSQRRAAMHLGHARTGKRFCRSICIFISTSFSRIEFYMEDNNWGAASLCLQRRKVEDQNEIEIWDASLDRQPKIQSFSVEEILQRIMGQTNNDCGFGSPFWHVPYASNLRLLEERFKTEVCTCSQFPTEAMQWIKEVELVDSVDELRSSSFIRGISIPNSDVLDARIASALNKIIHNSQFKRWISLEEQRAQKQDRFFRGRQIVYLIYDHFRVTGIHDSVDRLIHHLFTKWRYSGIRFKVGRNSVVYDENPAWWHLGRIVQIKNTRVWEIQDRIGIVRPGDSSEEVRTWLSQIENYGEEKYRARNSK